MDSIRVITTSIQGLYILETTRIKDSRGDFVKIFSSSVFLKNSLGTNFKESYYSFSKKHVIRGMHFQLPPHEHAKLVYVPNGSIIDVVLDLRIDSPTYGKFEQIRLNEKNGTALYISEGLAHGFQSLEENSCVTYLQTSSYEPKSDSGIKFDSFGMEWATESPIISERDKSFVSFNEFISPFKNKV